MLTPAQAKLADQALAKAKAAAEEAERAASGTTSLILGWLGADSTADAAKSSAVATRKLYESLRNRRPKLMAGDELADFLRAAGVAANVEDVKATKKLASPVSVVKAVVQPPKPGDPFFAITGWIRTVVIAAAVIAAAGAVLRFVPRGARE